MGGGGPVAHGRGRLAEPGLQELRHVQGLRGPRQPVQGPGPQAVRSLSSAVAGRAQGVRSDRKQPDRLLLFTTVLLCGAGLVMVTSASVAFAYTQHQSAFYYAERQAVWMAIGFAALSVLSRFAYPRP